MPPSVDEPLPQASDGGETACNEDGPAATKPRIERDRQPATKDGAAQIRCGVHQPEQPARPRGSIVNAELRLVEDLGAIYDRFICLALALGTELWLVLYLPIPCTAAEREHKAITKYIVHGCDQR